MSPSGPQAAVADARPLRPLFSILFIWLAFAAIVQAASSPRPPLRRLEFPSVEALEVFPRHGLPQTWQHRRDAPILLHSDSFRLTLTAFSQTFHLHLRPNDDLVHPAARVNYYRTTADGSSVLDRTEPLLRQSIKAFWGDVLTDDGSRLRMLEDAAGGLRSSSSSPHVVGWARIIVHSQGDSATGEAPVFEGAFSVNGDVHHVSMTETFLRNRRPSDPPVDTRAALVIFRNSDLDTVDAHHRSCSHDSLEFNTNPLINPALRIPSLDTPWYSTLGRNSGHGIDRSLSRRDDIGNGGSSSNNYINSIGQTEDCPKTPQIVYMGVAADCRYVRNYGSQENATTAILNDWNSATARYKSTFNVSLGIVQLEIHDATCPTTPDPAAPWNVDCSNSITLNDRLSIFSDWRGQRSSDNIGLWHLMSGCPTGTEVGVAWLSTLCQSTSSGTAPNIVSGAAVSTAGPTEWEVVTHEIGHNFGAIHDCTTGCSLNDSCCPFSTSVCGGAQQFIMNPTSAPSETTFSPCSIGNICTSLRTMVNSTCLQDPSSALFKTITFQMCGNGIVEDGEDCDPGLNVTSSCCNSQTCKFVGNAVCDPASSPCCTQQCGFSSATQVCRPAVDARCDIAESCSGTSAQCPADVTKPNGETCGKDGGDTLTCASGMCTSASQQCKITGASLNLTQACSSQSQTGCALSCQDPTNAGRCLVLQATLPNGSACGYGGMCSNGSCQPGSLFDTAKAWYLQNLQIAVPITVVAAIVALMLLYALISSLRRWCCPGRVKAPASARPPRTMPPPPSKDTRNRPVSQQALLNSPPFVAPPQAFKYPNRSQGVGVSSNPFHDVQRGRENAFTVKPHTKRSRASSNVNPPSAMRAGSGHPRSPSAGSFPAQSQWAFQPAQGSPPQRIDWVDETLYNGPRRR